jgi:hypothetical protein
MGGALVVGPADVYWTVEAPDQAAGGGVMRVSRCGGDASMVASVSYQGGIIVSEALAVDATSVYWGIHDEARGAPGGQLMRFPLAGGDSTPVESQLHLDSLATDSTSIYWSDEHLGVAKVPPTGGTPTILGGPVVVPGRLAVDSSGAYLWSGGRGLLRLPLDGGAVRTLAPDVDSPNSTLVGIAVGGGYVFFSIDGLTTKGLLRVPVTEGRSSRWSLAPNRARSEGSRSTTRASTGWRQHVRRRAPARDRS